MDLSRRALKEQFHAGLAMLTECVEVCPEELWLSGAHPRPVWRIAFHAAFFTQIGIGQDEAAYRTWSGHRADLRERLDPAYMEPYELPEEVPPYSREQMLGYIGYVRELVDPMIDGLDLNSQESGFAWYEGQSKPSNLLMNLRHLQGHVGQLSELLMKREIDVRWVGKANSSVGNG